MAAVPYEGHAAAAPFRLSQPESEATRLLYERHQRKILSFCQHQLGNREEAEDATQITFMNAFRGLKRGTSPEFESAWLYKIAHNVCLTKQRKSYRRRLVEAPSDFELIEELVPAHEGDSDELFGLTNALRVLPEQQRRALLLREWQGLSYREIADELNLSQAAVETLLFRARRSLAKALTTSPSERRGRGRPRLASVGPSVATLKSLLVGGGVKVAATAATVAATSVVAATPAVRHDVVEIVRSDAADRPTLAIRTPSAPVTALAAVHSARTLSVQPLAARHVTAKKAVAPVVRLAIVRVAAPRIVAPAAPRQDAVTAAVTTALAPAAPPASAVPDPVVAETPAPPPVADVPAPVVSAPPVQPPAVDDTRFAPGQVRKAAVTTTTTPPAPTVTVQNVIQPAPDPTPAVDTTPTANAPSVPPGQAKRDQTQADVGVPAATAPAPAATTSDATPDPGTTWTPPGQAKKADEGSPAADGRGQGKVKDA
jgi:RNA polymerase sigma factor (sigma-70 family)